jgi:MFS family permease
VRIPDTLRALRSPRFRRYYIGQAVSMIGTWIQSVAFMWLAYRISGSTWFTGLIGFLASAPYLFLTPLAGVLGDRVNRRNLLITVLSLMAAVSAVLAVLAALEMITMPILAAIAFVSGVCAAFEMPTRQSIFVQLIDNREELSNAVALNSMLMNGTRLIGPSIGGVVIAAFGEAACFAINALTYAAVVGALIGLKGNPRPKREPSHPLRDLADGWHYSMGQLTVRRMLFTLAAVSVTISPYSTLMPAIAVKTFERGPELVGLFLGAVGFGAFLAAVQLAMRPSVRGLGKWIGAGCVIAGLGAVGFGFSRWTWLSFVLLMMEGYGMFMVGATCNTIMQTIVDEDKRSRVLSFYAMFFVGTAPAGHYFGGWLADNIGAPLTFVAGGVICLAAGIAFHAQLATFRSHLKKAYIARGIIPSLEDTRIANP